MYDQLPEHVRASARRAYRLFHQNPWHPGLSFKKIDEQQSVYSVRIGIGYRALGRLVEDEIVWFWIGPHSEYDRMV